MTPLRDPVTDGDPAGELETLERRYLALGERLIALESEMAARLQEHTDERERAERELEALRDELAGRDAEASGLRDEFRTLAARAERLEGEVSRVRAVADRQARDVRNLLSTTSGRGAERIRHLVSRLRAPG